MDIVWKIVKQPNTLEDCTFTYCLENSQTAKHFRRLHKHILSGM